LVIIEITLIIYYDRNISFHKTQVEEEGFMQLQSENVNAAPQLAPPGAGLPWYHNLMLRFYVGPFVAGRAKWTVS
jgi:hypothetical protein